MTGQLVQDIWGSGETISEFACEEVYVRLSVGALGKGKRGRTNDELVGIEFPHGVRGGRLLVRLFAGIWVEHGCGRIVATSS